MKQTEVVVTDNLNAAKTGLKKVNTSVKMKQHVAMFLLLPT